MRLLRRKSLAAAAQPDIEPVRAPAPPRLMADLGVPDEAGDVWVLSAGYMMGDTFYAAYEGRERVRAVIAEMLDLGVDMDVIVALSHAAYSTGLSGDDLFAVAEDARSLAQVAAGQPDSFAEYLHSGLGPAATRVWAEQNMDRSLLDAIDGDLVGAYVAYLEAGWDPSAARMLLSHGLDCAGAQRIADQCPDGRNVVPGVWSLLVTAVEGDLDAVRAWSHCTSLVGMTSTSIREWHVTAGLRAPLLASAGVSLTEYHEASLAFDDERLALMASLRQAYVTA